MRRARLRATAALVGVLVGAGALAACSGGSSPKAAATAGGQVTPVHHVGPWIVDDEGRVVITHGFDMIWKTAPYYPPALSAQDARFLVSQGFTGARIGFIWAGLEPSPGQYDTTYAQHVAQVNAVLGQYGIRTLVDVHQDFFSARYPSGDGAPLWASISPGCTSAGSCGYADALEAFQNLWDDTAVGGEGLAQHFAGAWKAAAAAIGDAPNLLGFDVLNEPYAGTASQCGLFAPCASFEQGQLADFYRTVIPAIRQVAPDALVFYEPVPELKGNPTALPAPLDGDPNLGFTFHYYDRACDLGVPNPTTPAAQAQQDARCTPDETAALEAGVAYAQKAGAAVDFGEFGGSDNYTDDANMADLATQQFLNWSYWMYYAGASEPGGTGGQGGLRVSADKDPTLDALVMPYPEEVAGTPTSYTYDRSTGTMRLTYSTRSVDPHAHCTGAVTEVFVPQRDYPAGYAVQVTGGKVVSAPTSPWIEVRADKGAARVSLTLTRASGSTTQVPATALDPHAPAARCSSS